jgi:hypothetical protein
MSLIAEKILTGAADRLVKSLKAPIGRRRADGKYRMNMMRQNKE